MEKGGYMRLWGHMGAVPYFRPLLRRYGAEPVPVDRDAALEEAKRLLAFVDKKWPAWTHPDSWRRTLRILRRWTASPDALFAPEPFAG